jgi:hypothetical protein
MELAMTEAQFEKFLSHVRIAPSSCHEWIGAKTRYGYGVFQYDKKRRAAHRVAFERRFGATKLDVCHKCDNPACVNAAHLFPGTAKDNIQDAIKKGRMCIRHGTAQTAAKLDNEKVVHIRAKYVSGISQRNLAREFNVSQRLIGMVVRGESWIHVPTLRGAA